MSAFTSLARAFSGGNVPRSVKAYLVKLDEYDNQEGGNIEFQYFPETIKDSKETDWQAKPIPGLSHPLYQWTSGGERNISFTAIFTRDDAIPEHAVNTKFGPRNADIKAAIAAMRQFLYPSYTQNSSGVGVGDRAKPPYKLFLGLPGLGLGIGSDNTHDDEIVCIMRQCEVSYEAFFADGSPRVALVELVFSEIIQYGGSVQPVDRKFYEREANAYNRKT